MINGVTVTRDEILEHQRHLRGFLSEQVPEADLTDGSFINDVVVRSMAYVVALFHKEAQNIKSRVSVNDVSTVEDGTAAQVLDDLASNFFIYRNNGTFSRGIIRVLVNTNEFPVSILPLTRFTKAIGVNFAYEGGTDGETALIIGVDDFTAEVDSAGVASGNYYFDVPVVGEVEFLGSELAPGNFMSVTPSIRGLVRAFNESPFSLAESQESNFEFASRIKTSLTNRGMSSSLGIQTHLLDSIDNIQKVKAIGSSNPLMRRDLLTIGGTTSSFKTLGKCNIYASMGFNYVKKQISIVNPSPNTTFVTIEIPTTDMKRVASVIQASLWKLVNKIYDSNETHVVTLQNNVRQEDTDGTYAATSKHLEFTYLDIPDVNAVNAAGYLHANTPKERLAVKIKSTEPANIIEIEFLTSNTPELVETEVGLENNDIPGLDSLVYSYTVKYLTVDIKYFLVKDPPGDLPTAFIKADLARYVNSLAVSNANVMLQEIYSYFVEEYSSYVSGIDASESSMEMSVFLPNGVTVYFKTGTSTSFSSPSTRSFYLVESNVTLTEYDYLPTDYLLNLQVGDDTCTVYLDPAKITLTEVTA